MARNLLVVAEDDGGTSRDKGVGSSRDEHMGTKNKKNKKKSGFQECLEALHTLEQHAKDKHASSKSVFYANQLSKKSAGQMTEKCA